MRSAMRALYVAAFLGLGIGYYYFLGAAPTPSEKPETIAWWRPAGLALHGGWEPLAPLRAIAADVEKARHEGRWEPRGLIPLALFCLPPIAMTALGFALFQSCVWRVALLALGLTLCAFSYYGLLSADTWQDFGWRWPAVLVSTSFYVALFLLAPAVTRAIRARSTALQALGLTAFAGSIYFLSTEVTGTNPSLDWNLSPWPTLTLFGFLLFGLVLGVIQLAAGVGILASGRATGVTRVACAVLVAAAAASLMRWIPFTTPRAAQIALLAAPAAALAALAGRRREEAAGSAALPHLVAGFLILASIKIGQWQGEYFQAKSRDEIASRIVAALEKFRGEQGVYPDELVNLVPGYLPSVPLPDVGWFPGSDEQFVYTYLGDSFLLEFPSVLWVQCAYSPAYRAEGDEGHGEGVEDKAPIGSTDGAETLEASWSCESKPPRLW